MFRHPNAFLPDQFKMLLDYLILQPLVEINHHQPAQLMKHNISNFIVGSNIKLTIDTQAWDLQK
jgi:hypothetical protein